MIELRWLLTGFHKPRLQYRSQGWDGTWSKWADVPTVYDDSEAE